MTSTELRAKLEANLADMAQILEDFKSMPESSIDEEDDCDILGMLTDLECIQGGEGINENMHDAIYESFSQRDQVKQIEV